MFFLFMNKQSIYSVLNKFMIENYQFDKKDFLGQGSFGAVYKARNLKSGEMVAIKILDMKLFTDQFMLDALKNEIKVMQTLSSPNVARLIDCFTKQNQTYMVIELCDSDLRKLMQRKSLSEDQGTLILKQLMNGFKDLIDHKYMHRDIKPENCLIKGDVYKVADFGFATKIDITGRQLLKDCVGTPIYMSPQILNRSPYTAKSDIWSIGMMFYEMLFGKTAWSCRDMNSLLRNIKTQQLRFPYEKPVSPQVKDFIRKCLVIEEASRIGWNEIFSHEIFHVKNQPKPQMQLSSRTVMILRKLQDAVQENGIDPHFIFQRFDKDKNNKLDYKEFTQLILCVDPKTSDADVRQLFQRVAQQDQVVDYKEFQALFTEYDFSDLSDKGGQIIKDIQEVIKANNINVAQIFQKFDADKQGNLDFFEFCNLIRYIVPGLKEFEMRLIFSKFDRDGNGQISFVEFQYVLSKGTGQTIKDGLTARAQGVLRHFQNIIKSQKLDTAKIFQNFDKSGDRILDEYEFLNLMRAIDGNISKNDSAAIFHLFDRNNDHMVTYEEFKQFF